MWIHDLKVVTIEVATIDQGMQHPLSVAEVWHGDDKPPAWREEVDVLQDNVFIIDKMLDESKRHDDVESLWGVPCFEVSLVENAVTHAVFREHFTDKADTVTEIDPMGLVSKRFVQVTQKLSGNTPYLETPHRWILRQISLEHILEKH